MLNKFYFNLVWHLAIYFIKFSSVRKLKLLVFYILEIIGSNIYYRNLKKPTTFFASILLISNCLPYIDNKLPVDVTIHRARHCNVISRATEKVFAMYITS